MAGIDPCETTVTMLGAYNAKGTPMAGDRQQAGAAWTFWRGDTNAMLTRVIGNGWSVGAWGAADQPYYVPLVGPRFFASGLSEAASYRQPGFDGLLFHPGFGAATVYAQFKPQGAGTLTGVTIRTEKLGTASADAYIKAELVRANGTRTTIVPRTQIVAMAPALTLNATGMPVAMAVGDRVVVTADDGGNASEDWLNVDVSATITGKPVLVVQPRASANCGNGSATLNVVAGVTAPAATYRWRRNGVPMHDGPTGTGSVISGSGTATMVISSANLPDEASYDCVVTNTCGSVTGDAVNLRLCLADFNCDGFVDGFDYDDYVGCFEGAACPPGKTADFNGDGFADGFDYDDFVTQFETGCQ